MGAVLSAIDCDIRREVAVKYLLDQSNPKSKIRFVEEAQITAQLDHPNIVRVYDVGEHQGSPYIAKARAHKELKETALMTSTLLEYRKRGGYDPDALLSLAKSLGIDVFLGEGRFAGPDTVEVGGARLRFAKALIATGARAARNCPRPGVALAVARPALLF